MRVWVYKVNSRSGGWHFDQYFRSRGRGDREMGGAEWIRSPQSWAHLRRVRRGDLFVCYQADERRIYGLARAASAGYESLPGLSRLPRARSRGAKARGSGRFDSIDFAPKVRGGFRLRNPVDVRAALFRHLRAFTVPSRGTIHPLAADEWRALRRHLIASNPTQEKDIRAFTRRREQRR